METKMNLKQELIDWLDKQVITENNIGDIRRACFVPWDSRWNGIVRDETAAREKSADVAEALLHADGRLRDAAPELLEALQGVLRIADRKTVEFDAARAAIAKATGSD